MFNKFKNTIYIIKIKQYLHWIGIILIGLFTGLILTCASLFAASFHYPELRNLKLQSPFQSIFVIENDDKLLQTVLEVKNATVRQEKAHSPKE